jgi:hypothetical protein
MVPEWPMRIGTSSTEVRYEELGVLCHKNFQLVLWFGIFAIFEFDDRDGVGAVRSFFKDDGVWSRVTPSVVTEEGLEFLRAR